MLSLPLMINLTVSNLPMLLRQLEAAVPLDDVVCPGCSALVLAAAATPRAPLKPNSKHVHRLVSLAPLCHSWATSCLV